MPPKLNTDTRARHVEDVPVFDRADEMEDSDDQLFDGMRSEGNLGEDNSLNDGSSAMSDHPSNGPNNKFDDNFSE